MQQDKDKKIKFVHNLDQVVKICVTDRTLVTNLKHQPFKKRRWPFKDQPEGFVTRFHNDFYSISELEDGKYDKMKIVIKDNKAYRIPRVTMYFTSDVWAYHEFQTVELAESWVKDHILPKVPNVLISH